MDTPVTHQDVSPDDVRIVQGHSGIGLQVTCSCGCVNWCHVEIRESTWRCRNCRRVFTHYFPALAKEVLARQPQPEAAHPAPDGAKAAPEK